MSQPTEVNGKQLVGPLDLSDEMWREYEWYDENGHLRSYRIDSPVSLYYRTGGTTHRVVGIDGVTHCIPAPGYMGCVLRWKAPTPVSF